MLVAVAYAVALAVGLVLLSVSGGIEQAAAASTRWLGGFSEAFSAPSGDDVADDLWKYEGGGASTDVVVGPLPPAANAFDPKAARLAGKKKSKSKSKACGSKVVGSLDDSEVAAAAADADFPANDVIRGDGACLRSIAGSSSTEDKSLNSDGALMSRRVEWRAREDLFLACRLRSCCTAKATDDPDSPDAPKAPDAQGGPGSPDAPGSPAPVPRAATSG